VRGRRPQLDDGGLQRSRDDAQLATEQLGPLPHPGEAVSAAWLVADADAVIGRAFEWFRHVERCCSRFDADSELSRLTRHVGEPVAVSDLLYELVRFALAASEESDGAFDPTVGREMERRGFNREYATGRIVGATITSPPDVSYRDVRIDPGSYTITLLRPLMLDLGAVAKGFAVDMAARELAAFDGFPVDAGGDMYFGGHRPGGGPWKVGIRHPRRDGDLIDTVAISNRAVCTSGDYERRGTDDRGHIVDGRTMETATTLASVTVIAPHAMLADVLATTAFALGPREGLALLERHGVEGLLVTPTLERYETRGFRRDSILQDAERPADDHSARPAGDRDSR